VKNNKMLNRIKNPLLKKIMEKNSRVNPSVMEGISKSHVDKIGNYLDSIFRSAVNAVKNRDLVYLGYRTLTPEEEYKLIINSSMSKNQIDIKTSNLRFYQFRFSYKGVEFDRKLALPYVERGERLLLSGSDYIINPVLGVYPVSPEPGNTVFIKLNKDKIRLRKRVRSIYVNDKLETKDIIVGYTYKLTENTTINKEVPVVLYMFLKYKFYGVFKHFFNTKPVILKIEDLEEEKERYLEIKDKLLKEGYVEYKSTGIKPSVVKSPIYVPHNIHIFVKKEAINHFLETVVNSLLYSFDIAPRVAEKLVDTISEDYVVTTEYNKLNITEADPEGLEWIQLLGNVIFVNSTYEPYKILSDMLEYIETINEYLDSIIKNKMAEIGIPNSDIYDLYAYVIKEFDNITSNYDKRSSSLEFRYIEILYFILFNIITGINKSFLDIKREIKKRGEKPLTKKELNKILDKHISPKKIFSIISAGNTNLAIMLLTDTPKGHLYFKQTDNIEDQNRGDGPVRSKNNAFPPNTRTMHPEDFILGTINAIKKTSPTPRLKFNPFCKVDSETGRIVLDEQDRKFVEDMHYFIEKIKDDKLAQELDEGLLDTDVKED